MYILNKIIYMFMIHIEILMQVSVHLIYVVVLHVFELHVVFDNFHVHIQLDQYEIHI